MKQIGAAEVIINSIKTTADGGANITLSFGANDSNLIKDILDIYLTGDKKIFVGFSENTNDINDIPILT